MKTAGCYIAGVYREKVSCARTDWPELLRTIEDLQPLKVVIIAGKMDRVSNLLLGDAEKLIEMMHVKGAKLAISNVVELSGQ